MLGACSPLWGDGTGGSLGVGVALDTSVPQGSVGWVGQGVARRLGPRPRPPPPSPPRPTSEEGQEGPARQEIGERFTPDP